MEVDEPHAHSELAYQALGFMGQAGYSEEAGGVLPLCTTTWGDDKLLRAALAGRRGGPHPSHGWRGRTRLMAACHFGRLPRVSLLLSNGAPLEQRDAFGGTAMAAAVIAGRSAVVSALRSAGAGPYTPLTGTASSAGAHEPRACPRRAPRRAARIGELGQDRSSVGAARAALHAGSGPAGEGPCEGASICVHGRERRCKVEGNGGGSICPHGCGTSPPRAAGRA